MQNVALRQLPASCATSLVVTSACIVVPTTSAYASTLDEVRDFVTASHWNSFGLGCVVGALTGGIVVGIIGKRKKRRTTLSSQDSAEVIPSDEIKPSVNDTGVLPKIDVETKAEKDEIDIPDLTDSAQAPVQASDTSQQPVQEKTVKTEQEGREEQMQAQDTTATDMRSGVPTIDRGEVRVDDSPVFDPSPYLLKRQQDITRRFDPEARAAIINRRLPHFDESLYPDTTDIMAHDGDMFETAMRAMEDSLMDPETYFDQEPPFASEHTPGPAPNGFDASAYVENIMQDELERSRSHRAQRFSHVHLTVYDGTGTGDLDSTRKHRIYRPRHMRAASQEA